MDFYSPVPLSGQILYYRNGMAPGPHTLKIIARGAHNPLSRGTEVFLQAVQYSDASAPVDFGEGGGPRDAQRLIFGYVGRADYQDVDGHSWRPATEFIVRTGDLTDSVAKTWWTMRQAPLIRNTPDPELYRYGVHWKEITANLTVGPGVYHARLKFAETQYDGPNQRGIDIYINGELVTRGFDVFATAGGPNQAVDLVHNGIKPRNGIVEIRLVGIVVRGSPREAMIQAVEIGPDHGGVGASPKTVIGY